MLDGVITGGWSYVITAYAVTGGAILVYIWALVRQQKKLNAESQRRKEVG